jgi:anti-sigma B factor antagonist
MIPSLRAVPEPKTADAPTLRVDVVRWRGTSVMVLQGRLDETFEATLVEALGDLLERRRVRVVVDLRKLRYLNSRGVSIFIAAMDRLRDAGGDLKIAGAPPQARLVLERLGVDRLLQQFATSEEAIDAFKVPIQDFLSQGGLGVFVAGPRAKTFHVSDCASVRRLKSLRILSSKKAARDAGLSPCRRCGAP